MSTSKGLHGHLLNGLCKTASNRPDQKHDHREKQRRFPAKDIAESSKDEEKARVRQQIRYDNPACLVKVAQVGCNCDERRRDDGGIQCCKEQCKTQTNYLADAEPDRICLPHTRRLLSREATLQEQVDQHLFHLHARAMRSHDRWFLLRCGHSERSTRMRMNAVMSGKNRSG